MAYYVISYVYGDPALQDAHRRTVNTSLHAFRKVRS